MVPAVARVDHRAARVAAHELGGAFLGVAYDDEVGILPDRARAVRNGFALGRARCAGVGKANGVAAEPKHRRVERELRSGRGLIKQAGKNLSLADVRVAQWVFDDALRKRNEFLQFRQGQVAWRDQVFAFQHHVRTLLCFRSVRLEFGQKKTPVLKNRCWKTK